MAIAKKAMGNKGNYFNQIKKWTEPYIGTLTMEKEIVEITTVPVTLNKEIDISKIGEFFEVLKNVFDPDKDDK